MDDLLNEEQDGEEFEIEGYRPGHIDEVTEEEDFSERLQVFGARLSRMVTEQMAKRMPIEDRWLKDLRQYNGKYAPDEQARLNQRGMSKVFVNITRNKTNAAEARLSDMLFPTDDRNWGIRPTPIPDMMDMIKQAPQTEGQVNEKAQAMQVMVQAKDRAEAMTSKIEDQLVECGYHALCREMIHDACTIGTGIIKGPVVVGKLNKRWDQIEDGVSVLTLEEDFSAGTEYVSPWDFYPDMSASKIEEADFILERKLLTKRRLIEMARTPNYFVDQIRDILKEGKPRTAPSYYESELRAINNLDSLSDSSLYEMWEYNGPIEKDDLEAAGIEVDEDPLTEYYGSVQFIDSRIIRVSLHPMETRDQLYRVFCWEKDPSNIFGFGVPYLMSDQQRVMNAAWRMMLDNSGLSAGPQIVVNKEMIQPADGHWGLEPRKIWYQVRGTTDIDHAFKVYQISNNQPELMSIFQSARQLADEETNLPLIAQGEQSNNITKTAQGMNMLMNSANIVLRRAVKNFDDDVTKPHITSYYNWNMQFTNDPNIKGDFKIDARGSGALLAKELQQERLLQLSQIAASNPEFARMTNWKGLLAQIVKHMQISKEDVLIADEQIEAMQQMMQQQGQQQPQDPNVELNAAKLQLMQQELAMKQQSQQFEQNLKLGELQQEKELRLADLALKNQLTIQQLELRLGETKLKEKNKRDIESGRQTNEQSKLILQNTNLQRGYDTF